MFNLAKIYLLKFLVLKDLIKQFCYQLSYEKTHKVIKNIFVFPSDTESDENKDYVEFEIFEGKKIHFLYLYDQEVFDKYLKF